MTRRVAVSRGTLGLLSMAAMTEARRLLRSVTSISLALALAACGDEAGDSPKSSETATSGESNTSAGSTSTGAGGGPSSTTNASTATTNQATATSTGEGSSDSSTTSSGGSTTRGMTADGSGGTTATSDDASSSSGGGGSTTGDPMPGRSSGCGKEPGRGGAASVEITVDGRRGSYVLSLPRGYDPETPYALVFGFHGAGSTGADLRSWFYVEETANDEAIFVYPDGFNGVWEDEVYSRDFSFEEAIKSAVLDDYCVDPSAVFAFGFSYGGWATTQMACSRPDLVRGVASVAGGGPQGQCMGPIPIMIIHGSNDPLEPITSSEATRDDFLDVNQCDDDSTPVDPMPCVSYTECTEPLHWCPHDGEHNIPFEFDGAIWAFFSSLR